MAAAHGGHIEIVRQLMQAGARTDVTDAVGNIAEDYALTQEIKDVLNVNEDLLVEAAKGNNEAVSKLLKVVLPQKWHISELVIP